MCIGVSHTSGSKCRDVDVTLSLIAAGPNYPEILTAAEHTEPERACKVTSRFDSVACTPHGREHRCHAAELDCQESTCAH